MISCSTTNSPFPHTPSFYHSCVPPLYLRLPYLRANQKNVLFQYANQSCRQIILLVNRLIGVWTLPACVNPVPSPQIERLPRSCSAVCPSLSPPHWQQPAASACFLLSSRRSQLQNQSELRAPTAEKAAWFLDAAIAARHSSQRTDTTEEEHRNSHMLFTLHIYQYRMEKTGKGGSKRRLLAATED